MTTTPVERIADYEVIDTLKQPGGGVYVLARPPERLALSVEKVAVKIVEGRHDPEQFQQMTRELRQFATVSSRHLIELYDAGFDDGLLWYSMQYCPWGTLADPDPSLSAERRLSAVADAARGAHALHEAGVAHRDIQPANILLAEDRAVLGGIELARLLQPGRTVTSTAPIGDIEYTDPALIRGERASRASDIWSLGMTLHRVLAQTSAYPGLSPEGGMLSAVRRILTGGPEISTRLEPAAAELVRACVAPDPADRPTTALAVAEQIEAL